MTERARHEGELLRKNFERFADPANRAGLKRIVHHVWLNKNRLNAARDSSRIKNVREEIIDEILTGRANTDNTQAKSALYKPTRITSPIVDYLDLIARLNSAMDGERMRSLKNKLDKIESNNLEQNQGLPLADARLIFERLVQRLTFGGIPAIGPQVESKS